jgi:tetratricopeptide (TPR) repeat protein
MTRLRATFLASLLLALTTAVVYWPVLGNDFINLDDYDYVARNPHVQAGLTGASAAWALTAQECGNWHPLTWLSLQADCQLQGPQPRGFHRTNLLLHLANAVLLFLVLQNLTRTFWRSLIVAAFFALHPLHVESVAWVAERKDVLSTLFWLLTVGAYGAYARRPSWWRYLLVVLAFALGLMAKPMLVTLPCVLLLLDYWPLRRLRPDWTPPLPEPLVPAPGGERTRTAVPVPLRSLLLEKLPLIALVVGSCVLTLNAQRKGQLVAAFDVLPLSERLANAVTAYVIYLGQMVWPSDLAAFYPHPRGALPLPQIAGAGLLLVGTTLVACWNARRRPYLLVGWLWFLGTLVPVIGLVQVGTQAHADRYTYVPSMGLLLLAVWAGAEVVERWRCPEVAALVTAAALVACGLLTWLQVHYWENSEVLWQHTLAVTRPNVVAHMNLASCLSDQGRHEEAQDHFARAAELQPDNALAHYGLGVALLHQSQAEAAGASFAAAVRFNPHSADAHQGLGLALLEQGKLPQAAESFRRAAGLQPGRAAIHFHLAEALARQHKLSEALGSYRRAVDLRPDDGRYRFYLALTLYQLGQREAAGDEYRRGLRLFPRWPEEASATAWRLATHPDPRRRDGALALRLALQACHATQSRQPEFLDALAAAQAELGQFAEAVATAKQALALAAASPRPDLAQQIRQRLHLYENRQPFRDRGGAGG